MKQLDYIVNETKLLDMPYVKKDLKVKIKKLRKRKIRENDSCEYLFIHSHIF